MAVCIADSVLGYKTPLASLQKAQRVRLLAEELPAEKAEARPFFYAAYAKQPTVQMRVREVLQANNGAALSRQELADLLKCDGRKVSVALGRMEFLGLVKRLKAERIGYRLGRPAARWQWAQGDE